MNHTGLQRQATHAGLQYAGIQSPLARAVFADSPDAVVVIDLKGLIVEANPAFTRIFGWTRDAAIGTPWSDFRQDSDAAKLLSQFTDEAEEAPSEGAIEYPYRHRAGHPFPGETITTKVSADSGEVIGLLVQVRDVSKVRRFENTLSRLHAITSSNSLGLIERIQAILDLGSEHFELPLGVISRIDDSGYHVLYSSDRSQAVQPASTSTLEETFCLEVLDAQSVVAFHKAARNDERRHPCYRGLPVQAYLGVPIQVDGFPIGTLNYSSHVRRALPFDQEDRELIGLLAEWIGVELARKADKQRLEETLASLKRQAATDELTGLPNRRDFLRRSRYELDRADRYRHPTTLCLIDLDHFKRVNDLHGHAAGDAALRSLSRVLRHSLRGVDFAGRLGGEEFAVLLPETPLDEGLTVAERLRRRIGDRPIPDEEGHEFQITASIGVVSPRPKESLDQLLERADQALYRAKEQGRDRVCFTS